MFSIAHLFSTFVFNTIKMDSSSYKQLSVIY